MFLRTQKRKSFSTWAGLEPTQEFPRRFLVFRLNRSATTPCIAWKLIGIGIIYCLEVAALVLVAFRFVDMTLHTQYRSYRIKSVAWYYRNWVIIWALWIAVDFHRHWWATVWMLDSGWIDSEGTMCGGSEGKECERRQGTPCRLLFVACVWKTRKKRGEGGARTHIMPTTTNID